MGDSMVPKRDYSSLVDLLDRALEKGLFVSADVIISVADVPLIGLNLRLALASIETMISYGMMRDWDESYKALEHSDPIIDVDDNLNQNKMRSE
jgi:hypothetical protein